MDFHARISSPQAIVLVQGVSLGPMKLPSDHIAQVAHIIYSDGGSKVSSDRDFIYQHPCVARLAKAVREGFQTQAAASMDSSLLERFIDTYSQQRQQQPNVYGDSDIATVLLTGGTGSLG
ncbi:hypothetical protein TSTA_007450 [Talaromyces stipitatus ATCC 10500]|uniref:Uncharacterized protein n=1 Tax=Talaromyces stipitatus (strain ATCC 10500 / CBS 375.48 / QM 6759 / NRRL 1006) TaxID=441959 RepID=B8MVE6_TALSN|nr:uncharacterized protein TSTA_007450 [Talaromyces stipitatus ATCC 10500]EED11455.1 hypothetical protein TSTA_007450 [Talaromyces stipitatus ATCC 10500]